MLISKPFFCFFFVMRRFSFTPTPVLLADKDINEKKIASNDTDDRANKDKPNLKIDTVLSTGHEGLDAEKEWRRKSAFCEHSWSMFVSDEKDNEDPMPCDFDNGEQDMKTPLSERATRPNKHPAVEGEKDAAFLCENCHAICCKNCYQEYPSEENTPVSDRGFLEEKNTLTENKDKNVSEKTQNISSKSSLLDDYADTSTEMPDYTGGDD